MQGSHLDSVVPGPGINDNGSGSAYNLESAIQVAKSHIKPKNKIRFAWWGAEELNLLGSQFYVDSLSDEEFAKILANLNFDMIASPNFVRFVYDGDGSDTATAGPARSAEIEQIFVDWFDSQGLATSRPRSTAAPTTGRSSTAAPRRAACSPAPRASRRRQQAAMYGGVAGEAYDRCYHQACDTISNLNDTAFDQMSDAAATVLMELAGPEGEGNGKPPKPPKRQGQASEGEETRARCNAI